MNTPTQYWLMKSEPDVYSIEDLEREGSACWEGVRNYQARNFMRDQMRVGDGVLFYHSNAKPPGVAGIGRIGRTGYPDDTAWDSTSPYYDPKSTSGDPTWYMVDVAFVQRFPRVLSLQEMRERSELAELMVLKRGMRLSIQPLTREHFECIRRWGAQLSPLST